MQFLCILFIYQPLISLWARIIILSLNMNVSNLAIGLSSHSESQMASDEVLIITETNCYNY